MLSPECRERAFVRALSVAPTWQGLSSLLVSETLRPLYFWLFAVPVAAKLLSDIPTPIEFSLAQLEQPITIDLVLPFSWKVLYLASLALAMGRTLYVLFCPDFVRDHRNAESAISTGATVQRVRSLAADFLISAYRNRLPFRESLEAQRLEVLLSQYRIGTKKIIRNWKVGSRQVDGIGRLMFDALDKVEFKVDDSGNYVFEREYVTKDYFGSEVEAIVSRDQLLRHLCWDLINLQNVSRSGVRLLILVLSLISYVLALIPFLQSVWFVLSRL